MPATKHVHSEAFCVMKYATDDGTEVEYIWNSRDGVTPFVIPMRSGREGRHIDWSLDRYDPDYVPPEGSRVFVDSSPEMQRVFAERQVDLYWDHPEYPMSRRWETREEAIDAMLEGTQDGSPALMDAEDYGRLLAEGSLYVVSPVLGPTHLDPREVIQGPEC